MNTIKPKEIVDSGNGPIASFSYYDGIDYAKARNFTQTNDIGDIYHQPMFVVCCGDVMVGVNPEHFPGQEIRYI